MCREVTEFVHTLNFSHSLLRNAKTCYKLAFILWFYKFQFKFNNKHRFIMGGKQCSAYGPAYKQTDTKKLVAYHVLLEKMHTYHIQ